MVELQGADFVTIGSDQPGMLDLCDGAFVRVRPAPGAARAQLAEFERACYAAGARHVRVLAAELEGDAVQRSEAPDDAEEGKLVAPGDLRDAVDDVLRRARNLPEGTDHAVEEALGEVGL